MLFHTENIITVLLRVPMLLLVFMAHMTVQRFGHFIVIETTNYLKLGMEEYS